MIFIVDEEKGKAQTYCDVLLLDGKETQLILNADALIERLKKGERPDLIIIDVMLAVDEEKSGFTRSDTDDYMKTGLMAAERLKSDFGDSVVRRCVFLSNASKDSLVSAIREKARTLSIPYWTKTSVRDPHAFQEKVRQRLNEIAGAQQ